MCTRLGGRLQLLPFFLSNAVFLLLGCMPVGFDASEDTGGFVVGGASGIAGAGGTRDAILAGGTAPGSFGTTASVGIGGAGTTEVELGTGPGFQNDFRLLSTANGRLVQLLINPPTLVPIGAANLAGTAIATAPDGTLFGLTTNAAGNTQLLEISPMTGAVTPLGPVSDLTNFTGVGPGANSIAFAPNGTLFASPGNIFYGIDPITGEATAVLSGTTFGAFAFGPTGTLVGTTAAGLGTIDINTGLTTSLLAAANQIPFAPAIQGMTFGPDGFIYAVTDPFTGQANLVRIDPTTGLSVLLATYNSNLFGLAVQPL
jgi:hypothetical protein